MNKTYERIAEVRDTATRIRSGDVVWIGGTEGAANEFLSALSQRRSELKNVTLLVVTGNEPNKYLELLRHTGSIRVLSFYKEAIIESYRRSGCFGKYEFVTSSAVKAIGFICRSYGVNTMVVPVCPPTADGNCAVDAKQVQTALAVSACPSVTRRIALVDHSLRPSADAFKLDDFDTIGLLGDFRTRDIFDNVGITDRKVEAVAWRKNAFSNASPSSRPYFPSPRCEIPPSETAKRPARILPGGALIFFSRLRSP